ncbi:spore maturation protein B [Anaerosolibacter carboniphilus]|uniref:Spore maturation protein B n=1 Tax=Anaerosolibacter carboniphilus TaxID=1417629 RepID=A0A841L8H6_9FIRM|nr:nucleoside recognition domain-containing protein [Anaerosolibacter carboniphilus]MBB6218689.1 spore maturation protein B [Anaerosolibacter carboniphilus]
MLTLLNIVSVMIIPILITMILVHGFIKKVNIYEAFVEGAGEGFRTAIRIMPYMIAIFLAIGIFRESGALSLFTRLLSPITNLLGIPQEAVPLVIMRPISGSGALGIVRDIIHTYGADSFVGRVVSTMMGSAETIFYTMAVYFGAVAIRNTRHTLGAALISHLAAVIASVVVCSILFL